MDRINQLREMLAASPGDSFLQHAMALEHAKLGDDVQAIMVFKRLLQNDPDYLGSYYHLAGLLASTGNMEEAISWYQQGIALAKKTGDRHALGELQSALEELE